MSKRVPTFLETGTNGHKQVVYIWIKAASEPPRHKTVQMLKSRHRWPITDRNAAKNLAFKADLHYNAAVSTAQIARKLKFGLYLHMYILLQNRVVCI